jgi:hypothetical protein
MFLFAPRARSDGGGADDSGSESDDDNDDILGATAVPIEQLGGGGNLSEDGAATHSFKAVIGDDGEPAEVLVAADVRDSHVARAQLRDILDGMIGDSHTPENTAAGSTESTRGSPHVLTEDGKLVSTQQLVAQCNHLRPGEALSKDRLTRVMQVPVDTTASHQRTLAQVRDIQSYNCLVCNRIQL